MFRRYLLAVLLSVGWLGSLEAQESRQTAPQPWRPSLQTQSQADDLARSSWVASDRSASVAQLPNPPRQDSAEPAPQLTRITREMNSLPNSAGQVWREYDIRPYTSRISSVEKPQQAILDWILQETGREMWFNEPLGILSANRDRLLVYHTPEIHGVITPIVDRFVKTGGQLQSIDLNLVTVGNPNWRSDVYSLLQPIEVRSSGVEAWMVSKENAALLLSQLSRRVDFRQHSSGRLSAHDGQKLSIEKRSPVQFVQSLRWLPYSRPNFEPMMTQIDEGYQLSLSCLSSLDNRTIEATIYCEVDQVEKLQPISVSVPGVAAPVALQVPQLVNWRLKERFRWPSDQVLLLSCGVVATPDPQAGKPISRLVGGGKKRADALVFIEYRGPADGAERPAVAERRGMVPVPLRK